MDTCICCMPFDSALFCLYVYIFTRVDCSVNEGSFVMSRSGSIRVNVILGYVIIVDKSTIIILCAKIRSSTIQYILLVHVLAIHYMQPRVTPDVTGTSCEVLPFRRPSLQTDSGDARARAHIYISTRVLPNAKKKKKSPQFLCKAMNPQPSTSAIRP